MLADYRHLRAGCLPAEALEKLYPRPSRSWGGKRLTASPGRRAGLGNQSAQESRSSSGDQGPGSKRRFEFREARKAETASCFEAVGLKKASV